MTCYMTVYIDNARLGYRRMKMCHMIADSTEELLEMADKIGVSRRWLQHAGSHREHFDICMSKRELAIEYGAIPVTTREIVVLIKDRKTTYNG